eukprot:1005782-Rhodomonas_salina.1
MLLPGAVRSRVLSHAPIVLWSCYAMCGTEIGYAARWANFTDIALSWPHSAHSCCAGTKLAYGGSQPHFHQLLPPCSQVKRKIKRETFHVPPSFVPELRFLEFDSAA